MIRLGLAILALLAAAGCTAGPAGDRPTPATTAPASSEPAASAPARPAPAQPAPAEPAQAQPAPASSGPASSAVASGGSTPAPSRPGSPAAGSPAAAGAPGPIAPLPAAARAAGLVDIRTVVPDAIVDLRYATRNNFTGVALYPAGARCLVHSSMAAGLRTAADRLRRLGNLLVFWDCYRPHPVQVRMFRIVPDPTWVARPGPYARSHEAGRSVDVTLAFAANRTCRAGLRVQKHCLLEMGTGFDDFSARAHAFAVAGLSATDLADRARLREAMNAAGISGYSGEWWHFDGPGSSVHRPQLDVPLD